MYNHEINESRLITEALNAYGIFLKKGVRYHLEQTPEVEIIGEEYPVSVTGTSTINLMIKYKARNQTFILPINFCQCNSTDGKWVFFQSPEKTLKLDYFIKDKVLEIGVSEFWEKQNVARCIEGLEIGTESDLFEDLEDKSLIPLNRIQQIASLLCHASLGFLDEELRQRLLNPRSSFEDFTLFPIIVITYPLYVIDSSQKFIIGEDWGNLELKSVPWLILDLPYAQEPLSNQHSRIRSQYYVNPKERSLLQKEGIVVLSSGYISEFISMLAN